MGDLCYKLVGTEAVIVRICALASGSSGNSTFVATERTRLLVDAGLSFKETCKRLVSIGEDPERLDAILITHEHSDHVGGLQRLARKLKIPVYMTRLTAPSIEWPPDFAPAIELFQSGATLTIGDIKSTASESLTTRSIRSDSVFARKGSNSASRPTWGM